MEQKIEEEVTRPRGEVRRGCKKIDDQENTRIDHKSKGIESLTLNGRTIKTQSLTSNGRRLEGRGGKSDI